jgi:hypothetical protein
VSTRLAQKPDSKTINLEQPMTIEETRFAAIDRVGRQITSLIGRCKDPRMIDDLLNAKDDLNRMRALEDERRRYAGTDATEQSRI